ncbi:trypsin-like peptidase domain-containing protein [Bradyrhizobium sp. 157]|uniref:NB-ARC domain-containing protein n=1 Tax=Bradyrhizobium sp. 157 TaxID=2782631 RepID=UPI001FFBB552|nr:NB-ARC domain-containing protein [Bradyrhizobium sp. 157]MCK1642500.1 trypsin-like peptidase domain-containing protein [Bradyrhizobium sp. 157]
MSASLHEAFQVAILGDGNKPIGSGLVLDDRHVITCTHIAAQATTGKRDADPCTDVGIKLRTIPWSGGNPLTAWLRPNAWRGKCSVPGDRGVRDLAVLELTEALPGWKKSCGIYPGAWTPRHEMTLFAFPQAHPDGIWSNIVVIGGVADHWIQIDAAPNAQYRVQPGFSGSPLFDPDTDSVHGLVAEGDPGEGRTGFLIPGRMILEFLENIPDLSNLAERLHARVPLPSAPELPAKLTRRVPLVEAIKSMLMDRSKSVGLVGLRGMGGIGKSVVARLVAEDDWVRRHFHDGIEWISVGENKTLQDVEALQASLLTRLGGRIERYQSLDGMRQAIEKELANRRMLFIVDDVWTQLAVQAFQLRAEGCAVVYTSRRRAGFDECGVAVRDVELLTEGEAGELFRMHANLPANIILSSPAEAVLRHCNRHALAIVVAGSMLAQYPTEAELILERFNRANVDDIVASVPNYRRSQSFPDQETSIFRILSASFDFLKESDREFLGRLAIFPEDTPIPLAAIEILAGKLVDRLGCRRLVARLDDTALLTFHVDDANPERSTVTMHDLQRDFVSFLNKVPELDHRTLVEGLEKRFGGRLFANDDRPGGDYFRRFMVHHLIGAARHDDLFDMLIDPDWIEHRLRGGDQVFHLIADYDRALASEERS